ncbi:WGxxGxxG family protein [Bacillus sp. AFS055030]|uniref:WGxxGxxG family protein n=1 Tax=Bacillus sp. AFS055030 TaxID=2033507 RepID=UPI0025710169|nr:WGxxGxxG family protein [Bacillus sp. AFS055030]
MNKICLTLCTVSLSFIISANVHAASTTAGPDATQLDPSYTHNGKHINRDFDNDFNDPNHVVNDTKNAVKEGYYDTKNTVKEGYYNTKNNIKNTTNDMLNNGVSNDGNYYRRNVTPTPVANNLNTTDNDRNGFNYGWLGLLGLLGFAGLRRKEKVD